MSGHNNGKAVVLGLFDTGVATIRCLARHGIAVEGYDYDPDMPGFRSGHCSPELCPNPNTDATGLLRFLLQRGTAGKRKILYPASDDFVLFVSGCRDALSEHYNFNLPPDSLIKKITDKARQYELIEDLGLAVPATLHVNSHDALSGQKDKIKYPVFIKPACGHEWRKHFKVKGFAARDEKELLDICGEIFLHNIPVVIQELIPGPCSNNYEVSLYVDSGGEIAAQFTVQKLRQYPMDFGFGTLTVSVNNREVETLALKIIKGLAWRGFANIEFKYDERDSLYKFIELNARVWQQISHPEALGINFPLLCYYDLTQGAIEHRPLNRYQVNKKWIDLKWDMASSLKAMRGKELTLKSWLGSLKGTKAFGLFAADDIRPFLYSMGYGRVFLKALKFLKKKGHSRV